MHLFIKKSHVLDFSGFDYYLFVDNRKISPGSALEVPAQHWRCAWRAPLHDVSTETEVRTVPCPRYGILPRFAMSPRYAFTPRYAYKPRYVLGLWAYQGCDVPRYCSHVEANPCHIEECPVIGDFQGNIKASGQIKATKDTRALTIKHALI